MGSYYKSETKPKSYDDYIRDSYIKGDMDKEDLEKNLSYHRRHILRHDSYANYTRTK